MQETVEVFAPYLSRVRDLQSSYSNFNLGFPYTLPDTGEVVGYEVRGYKGFKSKANGTDSTRGAWIVDMSDHQNPFGVKNVYFAESGFDIMAFYQFNRQKIDMKSSVFVSLGGSFANQQVKGIMNHYRDARAVDCFDNDYNGRLYGIRMAGLVEGIHFNIARTDEVVHLTVKGQEYVMDAQKASIQELSKFMDLNDKVGMWKPAKLFKDWNDQVMNKPTVDLVLPNKFQRNEKLAEDRGKVMKI